MNAPSPISTANLTSRAAEFSEPLHAIRNLPIPLTVRLCHRRMKFRDFAALAPGDVISFESHCDSPLELAAGKMMLATGNAVRLGTRLGLRLNRLEQSEGLAIQTPLL